MSADEKAVVLVEQERVFRWVYATPDTPALLSRRCSSESTLHCQFDATSATGPEAPDRRFYASDVCGYLRTKLEVYVFRWVAGRIGGGLADYIDRDIATGLVPMGGSAPDKWKTDGGPSFQAEEGRGAHCIRPIAATADGPSVPARCFRLARIWLGLGGRPFSASSPSSGS